MKQPVRCYGWFSGESRSTRVCRRSGMLRLAKPASRDGREGQLYLCRTKLTFISTGEHHLHFFQFLKLTELKNSWEAVRHTPAGRICWTGHPVVCFHSSPSLSQFWVFVGFFWFFFHKSHRRESVFIVPVDYFQLGKNNLIKFTSKLPYFIKELLNYRQCF